VIRENVIRSVVESFQLEMFEKYSDRPDEYIGDDGIVCINCNTRQPPDQFCHMVSGEIKRKCRSCARNQSNLIKELKKQNPYPADDYVCPCCERNIEEIGQHGQTRLQNWVLDHCHETETFRGWLCHHCNVGLGAFSDDIKRIRNALVYLERHNNETSS
jgi:hypothetical protein